MFALTSSLAEGALLATILLVAAWIDYRTMRIPNLVNLALGLAGLIVAWLDANLLNALLGAAFGYALLAGVNFLYRTARGRDGIGMGDAKLLAGSGAWIGWMGLPFAVLLASALGLAFVAALRIAGRELTGADRLPFGPFLCLAVMIVWIVLQLH
nr:A24 family peptidase [Nitrosomonas nitrosa]